VSAVTTEENHECHTTIAGNAIQIRTAAIGDRPARMKQWFQVHSILVDFTALSVPQWLPTSSMPATQFQYSFPFFLCLTGNEREHM
jgi:hypothetical protein